MKYLCLIYDEEKKLAACRRPKPTPSWANISPLPTASRRAATTWGVKRSSRWRPPPPSAYGTARCPRPTARSPRRRSSSAGIYMIEARDLNDAIQVAAKIPSARLGSSRCGRSGFQSAVGVDRLRRVQRPRTAGAGVDGRAVYRADSRRVLATLIRLLGDFDRAEEAMHDAFAAAVEQWPRDGVPANPRAWLVSAGRFKAIDGMRRRARFDASLDELAERLARPTPIAAARATRTTSRTIGCG